MQLALAHHGDEHVERLLGDAVDLLDVEQRAVAHRRHQRAVDEHVGVVAVGQHPGRIEVADEAGRGQLGVALDELEAEPELVGDGAQQRALAGARRPLEQHVAVGGQRGDHQFDLALAADDAAAGRARPAAAASAIGSLVDHHAADVLAARSCRRSRR